MMVGPTLGYLMMYVYTQEPSLTMLEKFVNSIRAYLHGRIATYVDAAERIGVQFAITFNTGNSKVLDESYELEVDAPRVP